MTSLFSASEPVRPATKGSPPPAMNPFQAPAFDESVVLAPEDPADDVDERGRPRTPFLPAV
ncbi:hypothetical protein ACWGJ2_21540 [Streptomyces sp. NPDC054796]|uniref:Uncharacterized protein n=1 Tax=Streptomyces daliensis TaxID=299421 RepID=A0A8T4J170_9ACTN|nr:hypothetical protein [Streptomyces daliensis]